MKIIVDKRPINAKECLFSKENSFIGLADTGKVEKTISNYCNIDNKLCDFDKGHGCNKLKIISFGW